QLARHDVGVARIDRPEHLADQPNVRLDVVGDSALLHVPRARHPFAVYQEVAGAWVVVERHANRADVDQPPLGQVPDVGTVGVAHEGDARMVAVVHGGQLFV